MNDLEVDIGLKRFAAVGQASPVVAMRDLRFAVRAGDFVCVLGPSGCGKTTLLNIVAGLDRDYQGRISLPAAPGNAHPVIGYVFQTPRLLPWRTVEQNVRVVLTSQQAQTGIVDELLATMGLSEFRHAYPDRLSVGMTRRVALARAFAVKPDLLLMDEPFVSLDEPTAARLRRLLLEVWSLRPITVLFVTHDTREAVQLADRIIVMSDSPGTVRRVVSVDVARDKRTDAHELEVIRQQLVEGLAGPAPVSG